jgi:hypothetical protein
MPDRTCWQRSQLIAAGETKTGMATGMMSSARLKCSSTYDVSGIQVGGTRHVWHSRPEQRARLCQCKSSSDNQPSEMTEKGEGKSQMLMTGSSTLQPVSFSFQKA